MQKPTKFFLAGILAALIVSCAGYIWAGHLETRLDVLRTHCTNDLKTKYDKEKQENEIRKPSTPQRPLTGWESSFVPDSPASSPVCDSWALRALGNLEGVQKEFVDAQDLVYRINMYPFWAGVILFFSAIPWAWYFLLRRLKELREAILGK